MLTDLWDILLIKMDSTVPVFSSSESVIINTYLQRGQYIRKILNIVNTLFFKDTYCIGFGQEIQILLILEFPSPLPTK